MKRFFSALKFLTVIPVPQALCGGTNELKTCHYFFPFAGLLLGVILAGINYVLNFFFPPFINAVLTVIFLAILSNGLHIDGLADTFDGLFSSRQKDKILEIMKDSRSGPMGVFAVCSVFVLKAGVFAAIVPFNQYSVLLLTPFAGRTCILILMNSLPYARDKTGLGTIFALNIKKLSIIYAVFLMLFFNIVLLNMTGLYISITAFILVFIFSVILKNKIGGWTGDTLGALCEICEIIPGLIAVAFSR